MQTPAAPERVVADRFRLLRPLTVGPGVHTFLGEDTADGSQVVIKAVPPVVGGMRARLRLTHDAEALREIGHPPVIVHAGTHGDWFYVVRPFVPGRSLGERLGEGPLTTRETLGLAAALLADLRDLHQRGVLHRDLKPGNVIVPETNVIERVALVDFGFDLGGGEDGDRDRARHLSPEQAGLIEYDVGEWSDLYATGLLLFECLAGRPAFDGDGVGQVLRQQLSHRPPELRSLGLSVPRALDDVTQRLLRKDPRERYQAAETVLADLLAIRDALARGHPEPTIAVGTRDRRLALTEPTFVGRRAELVTLDAELARTSRGQGGLVFIGAESGGGKTRLLDELAQRGVQRGLWTLRGQGLDRAPRPFQMLVGVATELLGTARADPELATRVGEALGAQRQAVCAVLPELAEVLRPDPTQSLGPEAYAEARSVDALAGLLDALGSPERPALVLLDDCQWADDLTVKLLAQWERRQESVTFTGRHVTVVVAFRSEEVRPDHPLRRLRPSADLTLSPFSPDDVRNLIASMAGPLPEEAVEVITRLSEGSPFMTTAVLRGLVECGALTAETGGWRVEPLAMADVTSRQAAAVLARRLRLLPPDTLHLLSAGAVLGKEFDAQLATSLVGEALERALPALEEARRRRILWTKAEGRYAFVHDKLREAMLDLLPAEERRVLHRLAAVHIEQAHRTRVFELAYHFDAAGERDRALPYALAAAEEARARHALELAEQHYRIAARSAAEGERALRRRIAEGLGDVLMLRGRYPEASRALEEAGALADDPRTLARIEGKKGELAFKRGDVKLASQAVERALRLLGKYVPRGRGELLGMTAWEGLVQAVHTAFPRLLGRRSLEGAEDALLAVRLYNRLAYVYWFERGAVPTLWAHLRGMNLAERYPPTPELGQAYSEHAPVITQIPLFRRGRAYAEKSLAIRTALGDVWGQGQSLHFLGIVLYSAGRYAESIEKCRAAVRLLERTGDRWEVNTARWHTAFCLYRLGELRAAVEESRRVHQAGLEIDDHQAAGISLGAWAKASGGRVPAELIRAELQRHGEDAHTAAEVLQAEGVRLCGQGQPGAAALVFEEAQRVARRAGLRNEYVAPILPWLATARREEAEAIPAWAPARRAALVRRAARAARRGLRTARRYRNNLPHALRECGLAAAMRGRDRRAQTLLARSLAAAEEQGARYEHALTLLARGQIAVSLGRPGGAADVAAARQALAALGADFVRTDGPTGLADEEPATLSLVDRFSTVLDVGRRIASALVPHAVLTAVGEAAITLLRGEHCTVLRVLHREGRPVVEPLDDAVDAGHLRALVEHSIATVRPRVFSADRPDEVGESLILAGVKSALCTPVVARGRVVACFCVTHGQVAGLFGAVEERLAEFIAAIAGAALENAEGFAEIEDLSRCLEQRVEQRTAELARSNAELEQFAYVASHDLQEPLRMVASFVQLLQRRYGGQLASDADQFIGYAVDGVTRMQTLINDLLAYSRVGTQAGAFAPVNLESIWIQATARLQAAIQESGATLVHDPLPTIDGDGAQLVQVLQNLIGNGLKFRGAEPPRIAMSVERWGTLWVFSVRDNGIGIEPEFTPRLFVMFKRLHSMSEYPGSGIGLAICKKIVERHGGRIWIESAGAGKGTTVSFALPALVVEEGASGGAE